MHSCIINFSHLFITHLNMHKRVHRLCIRECIGYAQLTFHLCGFYTNPVQIKFFFGNQFSYFHFPTLLFTTVLPPPLLPTLPLSLLLHAYFRCLKPNLFLHFSFLPHLLHLHHRELWSRLLTLLQLLLSRSRHCQCDLLTLIPLHKKHPHHPPQPRINEKSGRNPPGPCPLHLLSRPRDGVGTCLFNQLRTGVEISCPTSETGRKDLGHICGSLPHLVSALLGMKPPKGQIREAHGPKRTILTGEGSGCYIWYQS